MLIFVKILNNLKEYYDSFFYKNDGIKEIYLVGKTKRKLTIKELKKPYDHVEFEYIENNKRYKHVLANFHKINKSPIVILSAVLNNKIDITEYINEYLMNDLKYLKIKHIIPLNYLDNFEMLEILDEECNSLIYRNLESRLDFLEPINKERHNSCNN